MKNLFGVVSFAAMLAAPAQGADLPKAVAGQVTLPAQPFDLRDVRLLEGGFRTAQETGRAWLLRLDADRLLHNFRATAGLPSAAKPYGGWEEPKCEVRGHTMGHYLTACSLMFAATGDAKLKERVDYIVAELAKCQAAMPAQGFAKGYVSAFPQSLFDRADAAKPVWAPYYTLHKICAGLLDAQQYCGNDRALEILRGMADWLDGRFGKLPREAQQKCLHNEHGGMAESLAELYARTGEPRYLKLAQAFRHDVVFDPAARGEDKLTGLHANTQFPKFLGYERIYELTGDDAWHTAATHFWTFVTRDRSFAIGGNSTHEFFFPVDKWDDQMRTIIGPETCNTYNMLKLTARLALTGPSAAHGDFYERALFNHIRSSQHPGDGNFVYYTPLRPGSYRGFSKDDGDFWCCVGTGMENPARYGEAVYFHGAGRVWINQFIASEAKWKETGARLKQETKFPFEPRSTITLKLAAPQTFTVAIRRPSWAAEGFRVSINGAPSKLAPQANGYVEINRPWKDGDQIEIELPMRLRVEPLPHSGHFAAILYGPLVLAGKLGREGMQDGDFRCQIIANGRVQTWQETPIFVAANLDEVVNRIQPVAGRPLEFSTKGLAQPADVTLAPFASFHDERYTVYWPVFADEAAWRKYGENLEPYKKLREQLARGSVDYVLPGDRDSERTHHVHAEKSGHGEYNSRPWRDANDGWFDYARIKAGPGKAHKLVVTYWGSDAGGREFDLIVNGRVIATQKLENNKPGEFFDVEYPVPADLVAGREFIALKFMAHPGKRAGGVFGIRMVSAE